MRLYKILNRYVDLDHVLSVTDPMFIWDDEHYNAIGFTMTLAFQEKPMTIVYEPQYGHEEYAEFVNNYFKERPGLVRRNTEDMAHKEWIKSFMPKLNQIHQDFISKWSEKGGVG